MATESANQNQNASFLTAMPHGIVRISSFSRDRASELSATKRQLIGFDYKFVADNTAVPS
jgi:hypothetical protein